MVSLSEVIGQYLVPEEQLLFSTEKVELRPHLTRKQNLVGVRINQSAILNGAMAITDRRIFIVSWGAFMKPSLTFEAIFDSVYAKHLIEAAKTKNEELKLQSQGLMARYKMQKGGEFRERVKILTGINLQGGVFGGGKLVLHIFTVYMERGVQKFKSIARNIAKIGSYGTLDYDNLQFLLKIKRPFSLNPNLTKEDMGAMYEILKMYDGKTDVTYGPILDIMQAKSQEIAGLVKELEALAI